MSEPMMEKESLMRESTNSKGNPYGGKAGFDRAIEKCREDSARGEHMKPVAGMKLENDCY